MDIRRFEPADESLLRQWWEIGHDAQHGRPFDFWTPWGEALRSWTIPNVDRTQVYLVASAPDGATTLGAARLSLPTKDNTHLGFPEVYVAPAHRRAGVGRALLAELERLGAEHDRTTFLADVEVTPGETSPGREFAAALGYEHVATEVIKLVDLAATASTWPALAAEAAAKAGDYRLVWWGDAAPEEHVAEVCRLYSAFLGEIPLEGMDLNPQVWTEEKLRRTEQRRVQAGYRSLVVAALAPDGSLAGYSNVVGGSESHWVGIDGTLVDPAHRGRRLGLAMKVRLHELVRSEFADCDVIATGNAGVNAHMNRVNERLGYREVEHDLGMQKVLAG